MYVLSVIPLSKSANKEYLTYFSAQNITPGSVITIPVRKQTINAIVIESVSVADSKTAVKEANFALRKAGPVKGQSFLSEAFLNTAQSMKDYFVTTTGSIIFSTVPVNFFKSFSKLAIPKKNNPDVSVKDEVISEIKKEVKNPENKLSAEKSAVQAPIKDRLSFYKTLIRESFARKQSVFFMVPTVTDAAFFKKHLERGIEDYVYTLSSDTSDSQSIISYNKITKEEHPVLIIATGKYLFIQRSDINLYILEIESSAAYQQFSRPHLDFRVFAEALANERDARLILGDTLLRTETLYRINECKIGEQIPFSFRLKLDTPLTLIDTGNSSEDLDQNENQFKEKKVRRSFAAVSQELMEIIGGALHNEQKIFLFTLRRGRSPITVCNDCGESLYCPTCQAPLVLYSSKKSGVEPIFACNRCREAVTTRTVCPNCGSWHLIPLGIGIELVKEELTNHFPNIPIYQFGKDTIKSHANALKLLKEWQQTGGILLGTEMALFYLDELIDLVAVVSIDALFSIPFFRINEKILRTLVKLQSLAARNFVIQTRNPKETTLNQLITGNTLAFYRQEIKERRSLNYPPFSVLIKITRTVTSANAKLLRAEIEESLKVFLPYVSLRSTPKLGVGSLEVLLKIPQEKWQIPNGNVTAGKQFFDPDLKEILTNLSPAWNIEIDPAEMN